MRHTTCSYTRALSLTLYPMSPLFYYYTLQIVNGQLVEHAFAPQVDLQTGNIAVKTLGFSAYVVAASAIPVRVAPTNVSTTSASIFVPDPTPRPVKVS